MDTRETMKVPSVNSPRSQEWFDIDLAWQDRLTEGFTSNNLMRYREYIHAVDEVETYREYGDRTNYYTITPYLTSEGIVLYDLWLWKPKTD